MLVQSNLRKRSINIKHPSVYLYIISIILKNVTILLKKDYDLAAKMHKNEMKTYLKVRGLKISGSKADLLALVFSAMKNNVMTTVSENCC